MEAHGFRALIRDAQAGDPAAQERLLTLIRPHLEGVARAYADPARTAESASDLVQEAWLRAWQRLGQFHSAADDDQTFALFRAWVAKLTRNVGRNRQRDGQAQRRKPPRPLLPLDRPGDSANGTAGPAAREPTPSANARAGEQARLVLEALAGLPEETDRTIVRLRFFDGLSLHQITERVPLTYDQVRDRYQKALRRLRRVLKDLQ